MAPLDGASLAAVASIAVFPSVIAYLGYNRGLQLIGANRSGPFLHLVPLSAHGSRSSFSTNGPACITQSERS